MKNIYYPPVILNNKVKDKVILFQQYFIHKNEARHKENVKCLHENVKNKSIDKIYLLNEKIYTSEELDGITSEKIIQVNIEKRLSYNDFFKFCIENEIKGYLVLANCDIYLNETIQNVFTSTLTQKKSCFCQLRLDYPKKQIFGPRSDSQDVWIFHSNFLPEAGEKYDFMLGMPGCDNHILELLRLDNFIVYNEPYRIETIHVHNTELRDYGSKDRVDGPFLACLPYLSTNLEKTKILNKDEFYTYFKNKLETNEPFYLPKVNEIESKIIMYLMDKCNYKGIQPFVKDLKDKNFIISNDDSIKRYIENIYNLFFSCEIHVGYNLQKIPVHVKEVGYINLLLNKKYNIIKDDYESKEYVSQIEKLCSNKKALFISRGNTLLKRKLKSKRFFSNTQITFFDIANVDFFINKDWFLQFLTICKEINLKKEKFTILLCENKEFGNLLCNYVCKSLKKSAFNITGILSNN